MLLFTPDAASGHHQPSISATPTTTASHQTEPSTRQTTQNSDRIEPTKTADPSGLVAPNTATPGPRQQLEARSGAVASYEAASGAEDTATSLGPKQSTPSVQATEDIQESRPQARFDAPIEPAQVAPAEPTKPKAATWQPKRPPRGPAVHGLTSRAPAGSHTALRRPSLHGSTSTTTTTTTQSPADLVSNSGASGSSHFNVRLANASQKLKNKLRHKHPIAGVPAKPPKASTDGQTAPVSSTTTTTTTSTTTETPPAGSRLQPVELQQGQLGVGDSPPSLESFFGQPEVGGLEPSEAAGASAASLNGLRAQLANSGASNASSQLQPSFVMPSLASAATPTPTLNVNATVEGADQAAGNATTLFVVNTNGTSTNATAPNLAPITVTRTYSTVSTSSKTRIVPNGDTLRPNMQTITEIYVVTQLMTSYQTLAPGESPTASNFEGSIAAPASTKDHEGEQPITNAGSAPAPSFPSSSDGEQLIARPEGWAPSSSSPGEDSVNLPDPLLGGSPNQLDGTDILEQLASGMIPSGQQQLADLTSQLGAIPDLNNPIVLAAAIQNPQLAAVILAAQQLRLKQQLARSPPGQSLAPQGSALGLAGQALAPQTSLSISYSTVIKPSTYTVRDTLYTTRLVSFKDGRTMRTRTVSEPGSVVEQLMTTMATEITPHTITMTLRPTSLVAPTLLPAPGSSGTPASEQQQSQATIQNAIIASQLAALLGRRQQANSFQLPGQQPAQGHLAPNQFQPSIQQLLMAMQQQQQPQSQQQQQQVPLQPSTPATAFGAPKRLQAASSTPSATPPLPTPPPVQLGPVTTTLTSLHVRTYTVHNAFKTIFRTITSTQLITSTIQAPTQTKAAG